MYQHVYVIMLHKIVWNCSTFLVGVSLPFLPGYEKSSNRMWESTWQGAMGSFGAEGSLLQTFCKGLLPQLMSSNS